jgi:RNA polymerase sigma-70 factor (ECF subfamily)
MAAFDDLFYRHRRGLLAYVFGLLGDKGMAEDVVQDCFVRFVRHIGKIRPERGASSWLYRVARNRAIDVMRRRRREITAAPAPDGRDADVPGDASLPSDGLMEAELKGEVRAALNRLPAGERDLLVLRFYGGLTFKEIARLKRRPLGTVLWQVRRSVSKLGKYLAGDFGGE